MCTKALGTVQLVFLLLAAVGAASSAAAQDDEGQPRARWRARVAARQYPDDELPTRSVAVSDDADSSTPPRPINVESPSNQAARRAKVKSMVRPAAAAEATAPETVPAPQATRTHANTSNRRFDPDVMPGPVLEQGEVYNDEVYGDEEFGAWMPSMRSMARGHVWVSGEALLWWLKGGHTPPLLTTSPAGSTDLSKAGVLPDATVLVGNREANPGMHAGGRIRFGAWLDECEMSGLEISYMLMGQNTETGGGASMGNPILARPFFDTTTGAENSHVIAFPNVSNGTFNASSTENLQGVEFAWRRAIVPPGNDGRIDLLLGYRFNRLTDGLEIADSTSGTSSPGTTINTADSFHTRNDFNGGDLGFATQWRRGRWSLDTLLKVGVGQTNTQVTVNGATAITTATETLHYEGGMLALPSNRGTHSFNQFSMMPEIGFTLACDVTPHLRASVGYTLLYWSNVARPGDQIDLNLDSNQFPPPLASGAKPAFALHTSDFWAQGVNLGLDYRF